MLSTIYHTILLRDSIAESASERYLRPSSTLPSEMALSESMRRFSDRILMGLSLIHI